jgi:hypothetical protein
MRLWSGCVVSVGESEKKTAEKLSNGQTGAEGFMGATNYLVTNKVKHTPRSFRSFGFL